MRGPVPSEIGIGLVLRECAAFGPSQVKLVNTLSVKPASCVPLTS